MFFIRIQEIPQAKIRERIYINQLISDKESIYNIYRKKDKKLLNLLEKKYQISRKKRK